MVISYISHLCLQCLLNEYSRVLLEGRERFESTPEQHSRACGGYFQQYLTDISVLGAGVVVLLAPCGIEVFWGYICCLG